MREPISPDALGDLFRGRGLTYEAVAVLGQVETSTISRIARGQSKARPQTIVNLARALGISPKRLEAMTDAAWTAAHPDERVSA
jgi:transcriptional regulator with XRE-family HTH domain